MHLTAQKIYDFISKAGPTTPDTLARAIGLGRPMLHRHLKRLVDQGILEKIGKPPRVVYQIGARKTSPLRTSALSLNKSSATFIDKTYLYITPDGHFLEGAAGFLEWAAKTQQLKDVNVLASEYVQTAQDIETQYRKQGLIDATARMDSL